MIWRVLKNSKTPAKQYNIRELSNLRHGNRNRSPAFNEVLRVRCVQGCYPQRLIDLWQSYKQKNESENDCPKMFTDEQLYIVLELAYGGQTLDSVIFVDACQACSVFVQVACALAVAESVLQFEHRDLHWHNILVTPVNKQKKVKILLDGKPINILTNGGEVTIIDFTLSRILLRSVEIYNDLSLDPEMFLIEPDDYMEEIYNLMKDKNGNEWKHYEPFTNVLWLDCLLDAMLKAVPYHKPETERHKRYIETLKKMRTVILSHKSAEDFVKKHFIKDNSKILRKRIHPQK